MLFEIFMVGVAIYVYWKLFRWKIHDDTIVCYTGGVGAGKSLMSCVTVRRAYRQQLRTWGAMKHLPGYEEKPLVYSSIPYQYAPGKWATKLTVEHLLLQKRIRPLSVLFLDEIDVFANQFQYNNLCIVNTKGGRGSGNFDEFCRLFRHYTLGGRMVCNAQALDNLNLTIRRRLNVEVNLSGCQVSPFPPLFTYYKVYFRHRTGNVEVSTDKKDVLKDYSVQRGILVPSFKMYDTHCYSRRYERVPYLPEESFTEWKLDDPIVAPYGIVPKLTDEVPKKEESPKKEDAPKEEKPPDIWEEGEDEDEKISW